MQGRAGKGTQNPLPPQGFAVGAQDDEGGVVPLGYLIQGLGRRAAGGFENHLQAGGLQLPRLNLEVGLDFGSGLRLRPGGMARGRHVGQDGPGSSQAAEFPAASDDLVPGGRQVGGQDYGFENGGILFKLTAFGSQPGREPDRRSEPGRLWRS